MSDSYLESLHVYLDNLERWIYLVHTNLWTCKSLVLVKVKVRTSVRCDRYEVYLDYLKTEVYLEIR